MQKLFKSVGKNVWIEPDFRCEFGKNITIGSDVYINFGCVILDCGQVTNWQQHSYWSKCRYLRCQPCTRCRGRIAGGLKPGNVHIGNRVWIGGNTILLPNITIGDDTVIGAGSIVTHDIPSGVVAVGNPCPCVA